MAGKRVERGLCNLPLPELHEEPHLDEMVEDVVGASSSNMDVGARSPKREVTHGDRSVAAKNQRTRAIRNWHWHYHGHLLRHYRGHLHGWRQL
jgi:hypothetical protein